MKLSICIPTYNRAKYLMNCLESVVRQLRPDMKVEVCISDNASSDETKQIVELTKQQFPIRYQRNERNLGLANNILKVVDMAQGNYVWIIGDDDLLMPTAIDDAIQLIDQNTSVDYFYANANILSIEYVTSFPQPFDLVNLPSKMRPFSSRKISGEIDFLGLIDRKISHDFLGGIFLSIFKRDKWNQSKFVLSESALADNRTFSHFDNTFPHLKVFAHAFAQSKAFFCAKPLSICLTGVREWKSMSPLVKSVRLVEALTEYRKNGLSFFRYIFCKNSILDTFISDLVKMRIDPVNSGYVHIKPFSLIASNLIYPNFYFSFVSLFFRKSFWSKLKKYSIDYFHLLKKYDNK